MSEAAKVRNVCDIGANLSLCVCVPIAIELLYLSLHQVAPESTPWGSDLLRKLEIHASWTVFALFSNVFRKIKLKRDKVAVDLTVHEGGDASDPDETDKHLRNKLALFQALEYPLRLV